MKRVRGMSLVELMIAVGIMTVILMSMSTMIYQFLRAQSAVTARDEINDFASSLAAELSSGQSCGTLLAGKSLAVAIAAAETFTPVTLPNWGISTHLPTTTAPIAAGTLLTPKLRIDFVGMQHKTGSPLETFTTSVPLGATFVSVVKYKTVAQVKLGMSILEGETAKALPVRFFDVPVVLGAPVPSAIESCRAEQTLKEACQALDPSAWETSTNTCNFEKKKCQPMGYFTLYWYSRADVPAYADPSGNSINPLTGGTNCPTGSIPYLTGTRDWVTNPSCGKKCTETVNHSERYFMCMLCP